MLKIQLLKAGWSEFRSGYSIFTNNFIPNFGEMKLNLSNYSILAENLIFSAVKHVN